MGSNLGWADTSFLTHMAAPATREHSKQPGIVKVSKWLVDSGCGYGIVDAHRVLHL